MTQRARRNWVLVVWLAITSLAVVGALLILSGWIDRFSADGKASRGTAYGSVLLFWALASGGLWLAAQWRTAKLQILLATVVFGICLLLGEVAIRIVLPHYAVPEMWHVPSPKLHHILPPDLRMHWGRIEGRQIFVTTNGDGFRTRYTAAEFQGLSQRIVMMGDSFTMGSGVNDDEAYPVLVEQQLRQAGRQDVGVLNAGMISFSPFLHRRLAPQLLRDYRPQLLVLMLDCGDIGDDLKYEYEAKANAGPTGPFARFRPGLDSHYGALWRLAKPWRHHPSVLAPFRLLSRVAGNRETPYDYYQFRVEIGETVDTNRFFIYRHPLTATRKYFDRSWEHLEEINRLCLAADCKFLLLVCPRFHHWNVQECPQNWERDMYRLEEPFQFSIFEYFQQKQQGPIDIHSLLDDFRGTKQFPLCFAADPHWNATGHKFVAQVITELVAERLPEKTP